MWINKAAKAAALCACYTAAANAQTPLSAIDWLSDSVATPTVVAPNEVDISKNALPETVTVMALGATLPDAVGLRPISVTGLPRNLWGSSASVDLARRLNTNHSDMLPAMQGLLYTLLLAELDPPADAGPASVLFLARIDTLLALGAVEPANALLERAGSHQAEIFRRSFDTSLLLGAEDGACEILRNTPELSPTYPARIFCLARGGDWDAAALTLETGRAIEIISQTDAELLRRFLDPELFENEPPLAVPSRPNPLVFRMMAAIGQPIPSANMPRAFANADLSPHSGWKVRIEAAERLTQTGAIPANRLLGLYTEQLPAASGGVWDRVEAVQRFDVAVKTGDPGAVSTALEPAWRAMKSIDLETAFAELYADALARLPLQGDAAALAFKVGLLSKNYEKIALDYTPTTPGEEFLIGVARGVIAHAPRSGTLQTAIFDGFASNEVPVRLKTLVDQDRLGEAILRNMQLFSEGARGDFDAVSDAIAFFRAVGLEDIARRGALQLLLLDRRG